MMDWQGVHEYCLSKPSVVLEQPFGPELNVYKVISKLFAILDAAPPKEGDEPVSVNLKCEPELAIILRQTYKAVQPGYHMNKRHWNTVILDGSIPDDEIIEMIDNSYDLVAKGLKKAERQQLGLD